MNATNPTEPKKFFVITDSGETGPFTPPMINRMFSKKEIIGSQLCRREDSSEYQRLDEVFRHMSPSQAAVVEARANIAAYNIRSGKNTTILGALMVAGNIVLFIAEQRISLPFLIVGIGLLVTGSAQLHRGEKSQKELIKKSPPTSKTAVNAPSVETKQKSEPSA